MWNISEAHNLAILHQKMGFSDNVVFSLEANSMKWSLTEMFHLFSALV